MASDTVYDAVETFLIAQWTATAIYFENIPTDYPRDGDGNPLPFVFVELVGNLYGAASLGSGSDAENLYRENGTVFAHVFVASGSGSRTARGYATQFVKLFKGRELGPTNNIIFLGGSIGGGAPGTEDGVYWRLGCNVDYQADNP
jgi:hypothetical protein